MSAEIQFEAVATDWLTDAFNKQKKAYRLNPFADVAERKKRLLALKALMFENKDAICSAINKDFKGRASYDTLSSEYLPSMMGVNDALRHLNRWMRPKSKIAPLVFQPISAKVVPQPLGVIGIMVPWNFPLLLSVGPLIAALAAGNHSMVKMSEFTPAFSQLFAELVAKYFEPSVVTVINGELSVAQAFSGLAFNHLLFTGSTTVGRHIMRAASEHLTPVTLELGGKSPVVIDRSIPIQEAAERLVYPKCINSGQACVAPDYVLCPEEHVDEFVQHYLKEVGRQFGDVANNDQYTAIINSQQRDRLVSYVVEAKAAGAKMYVAGPTEDLTYYGAKLPPIILTNVPASCKVMVDEIFGPILPVISYKSLDEAIGYITERPRPLALYVFGYEKELRPVFIEKTHSGALMFNEAVIHVGMDNLPFGGVGASGMGHYHGKYGFDTFSKLKPVVAKQRLSSLKLIYPPYKSWLMNSILRLFCR